MRSLSSRNRSADLIERLKKLDTACLCDAEKSIKTHVDEDEESKYSPLRLLEGLVPRNSGPTMAGRAHTVQFKAPNDFLAMLDGLSSSDPSSILVVNTLGSTRAVAGEMMCAEADRLQMSGLVIDGPMRDVDQLQRFPSVRCYSSSLTPYSGTVQEVGEVGCTVQCGKCEIAPGDILVGDSDGIIAGPAATFEQLVDSAEAIQRAESKLLEGVRSGRSLLSMTNYNTHAQARKDGQPSTFLLTDE